MACTLANHSKRRRSRTTKLTSFILIYVCTELASSSAAAQISTRNVAHARQKIRDGNKSLLFAKQNRLTGSSSTVYENLADHNHNKWKDNDDNESTTDDDERPARANDSWVMPFTIAVFLFNTAIVSIYLTCVNPRHVSTDINMDRGEGRFLFTASQRTDHAGRPLMNRHQVVARLPEITYVAHAQSSRSTCSSGSCVAADSGDDKELPWSCCICLEEYESHEKLRILPRCGHVFHTNCIMPWLTTRSPTCPLCNKAVMSDNNAHDNNADSESQMCSSVEDRIHSSLRISSAVITRSMRSAWFTCVQGRSRDTNSINQYGNESQDLRMDLEEPLLSSGEEGDISESASESISSRSGSNRDIDATLIAAHLEM